MRNFTWQPTCRQKSLSGSLPAIDTYFNWLSTSRLQPIKVIVDPVFLAIRFCVDLVITLNLSELAYFSESSKLY